MTEKEFIVPVDDIGVDGAYFGYTELIRCKDCKHFNPMRKVWRCTQSMVGMISEAEDYCSRAERRGEE